MEDKHRTLLKENRMDLARDLDVDNAVSYLYSRSILSENDRDEILALKIQLAKSEKLLDVLPKRGPEAFDAFVQFLDENQSFLSKLLKPNSSLQEGEQPIDNLDSPPPMSDKKPAIETSDGLKPQKATETSTVDKSAAAQSEVDGSGAKRPKEEGSSDQGDGNQSSRFRPSTYKDGLTRDSMYPMANLPRGKAFIINNKTFLRASGMQESPRKGTDVDAEALEKLFRDLKFDTRRFNNQSSKQIIKIFDDYAAMDHSRYDCIICAILTHGEEGLIYSTDGTIMIKDLTTKFRCKNLCGIPKLFFFQACQGSDYMDGVEETDGPGGGNKPVDEVDGPGNNKITLPIEADFMYAYSTVPGYFCWRNSVRGSWFVEAIVSVFRENALTMDVLRMMTRVNLEVAKQKSNTNESSSKNKKQIPSVISQLRKDLYFFPENVLEDVHGDYTDATFKTKKPTKNCSLS